MNGEQPAVRAVVLAGDRSGGSALARAHGQSAGVLVPVAHRSCIEHVVAALRASRSVGGGIIVGPAADIAHENATMQRILSDGDFTWEAPADGPSASALRGAAAANGFPLLVTAGDHALLDADIVDAFCRSAAELPADFVVGLVPHESVHSAFPESRRTVLRFRDGAFCGSNLFMLRTAAGCRVFEFWQSLESARKQPWKIAFRLGPVHVLRYLARSLTTAATFEMLSKRAGCAVGYCVVPQARAAVDVDNDADRRLAERLLSHG